MTEIRATADHRPQERRHLAAPQASRVDAFRRARRHSRLVRVLKVVLPGSALLVAAGFLSASWLDRPAEAPVNVDSAAYSEGKLVMANPKLEGLTGDNLPYTMTAGRAVQDSLASGLFQLEDIDATLPIGGDIWATVASAGALFDRDKNTIRFDTELQVTTTDGLVAKFKSALIDVGNGGLTTSDPVEIRLAAGTQVAADSMTVLENGAILMFEGRVRMAVNPPAQGTASQNTGDGNGG